MTTITDPTIPHDHQGDWRARVRDSRWGSVLVLVFVTIAVVVGAFLVMRPDQGGDSVTAVQIDGVAAAPKVGGTAPAFTATTLDGAPISLEELKGRPVWLVFMASWCTACRAEAPDIQSAHQQAGPDGVAVVAVYLNEDASAVRAYTQRLGLTFTHLPDPDAEIAAAYGVKGIPAHFFIDGAGVVRATALGILSPQQIDEAVAEAGRS